MKTAETKGTHSQQHAAAQTSFFHQGEESSFFSEQSSEYTPFFSSASTSSFIQPKSAPGHKPFFQPTAVPLIQAKCAACEAEEREQAKEESGEMLTVQQMPAFESDEETAESSEERIQHQAISGSEAITPTAITEDTATITNPSIPRGGGVPLPENTRQYMLQRLGSDFSDVRIHHDSAANKAATDFGAKAFTTGSDIYFARNYYDPTTSKGKRLIAHELTHVMQQRSGQLKKTDSRSGGIGTYNQLEQQAETVEQTIQKDEAAISEGIIPSKESVQCNYSETLQAMRALASGGVTAIAQWLIGRLASTHPTIARLSQLRIALSRFQRPLIFQQEDITRMSRLYQSFIRLAPTWLPVPRMNFTPVVQRNPVIVIGGIALTASELMMLAMILVILYWLWLRGNPELAEQQEADLEEFWEAVNRAMSRPRTITETAPEPAPESEPEELGPDILVPVPEPRREEEPAPCCCCVTSLEIPEDEIERNDIPPGTQVPGGEFPTSGTVGHDFKVLIGLSYHGEGEVRGCRLYWFETTNIPYARDTLPNKEYDLYQHRDFQSGFEWFNYEPPCPASVPTPDVVEEIDSPSLSLGTYPNHWRSLEFRIRVESGTGCDCPQPSFQEKEAEQVLAIQNGEKVEQEIRFDVYE